MKEYEHSFEVKSILPTLEYCRQNGYKELGAVTQNRVVYENANSDHIIARITTEKIGNKEKIIFDCKNIAKEKNDLKISDESIPLELNADSKKAILSMLEVMEFHIAADNIRTRYSFEKEGVIFEIDDYTRPQMKVVAIEGDEEAVERVYRDVLRKLKDDLV